MKSSCIIAALIVMTAFGAESSNAQELSRYRGFQLESALPAVAKQLRVRPTDSRIIHRKPALVEELEWQLPFQSERAPDSVRSILFTFYEGKLFRLVVGYDRERTEGLTAEDFIEAISREYGPATSRSGDVALSSTYVLSDGGKIFTERTEKVIARWENAQYSYSLFQPSPASPFGLAISSKALELLAQKAVAESLRIDEAEAPERERARRLRQQAADLAAQVQARKTNKAPFKP